MPLSLGKIKNGSSIQYLRRRREKPSIAPLRVTGTTKLSSVETSKDAENDLVSRLGQYRESLKYGRPRACLYGAYGMDTSRYKKLEQVVDPLDTSG
jgi:hypothetical protein